LSPECEADVASDLCAILMDDGGCGHEHALEWRIVALERIEAALRGEAAEIDRSTESFFSEIGREVVKLLSTGTFKRAIEASIEFFRMPKGLESRLEVEI
jgi:hypothetical protein